MRVICLALPLTFLTALACSGPRGGELFSKDGLASGSTGNVGGSFGASAGTVSAGSPNPSTGGALESSGGGSGSAAGSADKAGGPPGGSAGSGGSGGQDQHQPQVIESCDMLDDAVTSDDNGHCYRVNSDLLTFAAARDACSAAGGYLVAVSSEAEDDFVHGLLGADHWIGANDGRSDGSEGVGSYTWLSGDDWDYTNWEDGQPNAVATNCPNEDSGANCFEHCAYQDESGGWIDRACWHTIASVCEWEPKPKATPEQGP
jgi:Lectin C-type domain